MALDMYRLNGFEPFDDASALLGVLTDDPAIHWSMAELGLHMGWEQDRVETVAAELRRDGVAHDEGGFVWPSRAAVRCRELLA